MFPNFSYETRDMYHIVTISHHKFECLGGATLLSVRLFGDHDLNFASLIVFRIIKK